jgi:hypothetical protein
MHPLALFESRIANVLELAEYRDDKGIRQAQVAGAVLREWIRDELDEHGWRRDGSADSADALGARKMIRRILRAARRRKGLVAVVEYGIDLLASIPADHPALPDALRTGALARGRETVARAHSRASARGRAS